MTDADRMNMLDFAVRLARHVGREILLPRLRAGGVKPAGFEKKGANDLVTEADKLAEREIVSAIRAKYPEHAITAEEETRDAARPSGYRWLVDPLDGTTNFVHGLPFFCVSIACYSSDGGEVGVCYSPYMDECFFAAKGYGARLNSEAVRLHVSAETKLSEALLVTGFAYDQGRFPNVATFAHFLPKVRGIRRLGSAALDLCYVGAGRFDAYWERGLNSFDCAAGALIVREAGGRVTDFEGGDAWLEGRNLIASNGAIHEAVRREVGAALGKAP